MFVPRYPAPMSIEPSEDRVQVVGRPLRALEIRIERRLPVVCSTLSRRRAQFKPSEDRVQVVGRPLRALDRPIEMESRRRPTRSALLVVLEIQRAELDQVRQVVGAVHDIDAIGQRCVQPCRRPGADDARSDGEVVDQAEQSGPLPGRSMQTFARATSRMYRAYRRIWKPPS